MTATIEAATATKARVEAAIQENERAIAFLQHVDVVEKGERVQCPICIAEPGPGEVAVTRCGHTFCLGCIQRALVQKPECPNCRHVLHGRQDVFAVREHVGEVVSAKDRWREAYGAKIGELLALVQKGRCILFSVHEAELDRMNQIFKTERVAAAWCRGNAEVRNAAIRRFREGECQVLLMSLRHCATGADLGFVNNVVLLGPIQGSAQSVRDIENQALGRAVRIGNTKDVKLWRLITRDTVEEALHRERHPQAV